MKIGIVGAGSIGLLFAAYLSQRFKVTIFPRREEQAKLINNKGITVQLRQNNINQNVSATVKREEMNSQDLMIIAVKQYQLEDLLPTIQQIETKIPLLFLQNGMMHLTLINKLKHQSIFVGSIEHGALKLNETMVIHNGVGITNIASYKGPINSVQFLVKEEILNFPFRLYESHEDVLLKKLLVNAMINPLTAILQVKNGELIKNENYHKLFRELYQEIILLFPHINQDQLLMDIISVCKNTADNESSMLKDIKAHRTTEIDAIIGYILNLAQEKGIPLPITNTLYYMVKGLEKGRDH